MIENYWNWFLPKFDYNKVVISMEREKKIYFTSDLHFGHDREFIWRPRGFNNVYEMNNTIIKNWNEVVDVDDDVYVLGDLMLGDNWAGRKCLTNLKGNIHIILGNHDSEARVDIYRNLYNVVEVCYATQIKIDGWNFYLSHYPTMTCNLEKEFSKNCLLNLYGHTHQKDNFYNGLPFCYHVGLDSHNNQLVSFEQVIEDITKEVKNCEYYL